MKPDDERLSRAMHALEPNVTDTPDLFEKVAAGARRRRRRVYSTSAVGAAALAVAAVAIVPTLTSGVSHSQNVQTAAGNGDVDPGFTGLGAADPTAGVGTATAAATPSPAALPPSLPITSGQCAPGLTVAAEGWFGPGVPPKTEGEIRPGTRSISLRVGDTLRLVTTGRCASNLGIDVKDGQIFGPDITSADQTLRPAGGGETILTATRPGAATISLRLPTCAAADAASCRGGTGSVLATINVDVTPAPVNLADAPAAPATPPADSSGCPTVPAIGLAGDLEGGATDVASAVAAAIAAVPARYGSAAAKTATVTAIYPASSRQGYGIVADSICGKALGDASYVVELSLGGAGDSASAGSGQLFVARFGTSQPDNGWQVWFQYH